MRCLVAAIAVVSVVGLGGCVGGSGPAADSGPGPSAGVKTVKLVGFDMSPPLVQALKEGKIQGLVLQDPFRMGWLSVEAAAKALEGETVKAVVPTGETLLTPANLEDPAVQALLNTPKADHSENASLSGPKTKKWRVIVIPKGTTHEHWKSVHAGAVAKAKELGSVEIIWQGPTKEDDRTDQIKLVQSAVASKVDAIVLAPLDAKALAAPAEAAVAAGIPVVIIDSGLDSTKPVSYVATDNYHGGVLAARRLGELLEGRGKIILMRYAVGSKSTEEREQGFTDTMEKEFPEVTFLDKDQYAGATSDAAQRVAQALATKYRGQVDGIFCPNESSTLGMLRALKDAGMLESR